MKIVAVILTAVVALEHIGIMVLEMFFWDHPVGRRIFGMTPEVSAASATLAANQGLYNGFLAAGLIWGLVSGRRGSSFPRVCCSCRGFGAATAKGSILFTQALPAAVAFAAVLLADRKSWRLLCRPAAGRQNKSLFRERERCGVPRPAFCECLAERRPLEEHKLRPAAHLSSFGSLRESLSSAGRYFARLAWLRFFKLAVYDLDASREPEPFHRFAR